MAKKMKVVWSRPGFLVRRLHQIHMAIFLECADEQVTPIQWGIMTIVESTPGVGHVEIAEELGLDRSNVANVVDRLTRRPVALPEPLKAVLQSWIVPPLEPGNPTR